MPILANIYIFFQDLSGFCEHLLVFGKNLQGFAKICIFLANIWKKHEDTWRRTSRIFGFLQMRINYRHAVNLGILEFSRKSAHRQKKKIRM